MAAPRIVGTFVSLDEVDMSGVGIVQYDEAVTLSDDVAVGEYLAAFMINHAKVDDAYPVTPEAFPIHLAKISGPKLATAAGGADRNLTTAVNTYEQEASTTTGTIPLTLAGAGADDSSVGTVAWSNPGNVASTVSYATAVLNVGDVSHYLKATGFGFTGIPDDAVVTALNIEAEAFADIDDFIRFDNVQVVLAGSPVGASTPTPNFPFQYVAAGAPPYLETKTPTWDGYNVTTPGTGYSTGWLSFAPGFTVTGADVKDSGFGVAISVTNDVAGTATASIRRVRIRIQWQLVCEYGEGNIQATEAAVVGAPMTNGVDAVTLTWEVDHDVFSGTTIMLEERAVIIVAIPGEMIAPYSGPSSPAWELIQQPDWAGLGAVPHTIDGAPAELDVFGLALTQAQSFGCTDTNPPSLSFLGKTRWATSPISKAADQDPAAFGLGLPGLVFWLAVARHGTDPGPSTFTPDAGVLLGTLDMGTDNDRCSRLDLCYEPVTASASNLALGGEWDVPADRWALASVIYTGPLPNPVPPFSSFSPCIGTYEVLLFTRGLAAFQGIIPWTRLTWERSLDQTSKATVTVGGFSGAGSCCTGFENLQPWVYEIAIYRNNVRIWSGPLVRPSYDTDAETLTLEAWDITAWWGKRLIHNNHTTGRRDPITGVLSGADDLANILKAFSDDAMSVDNSPGLTIFVLPTGITSVVPVLAKQHQVAEQLIQGLTNSGIDWTVIDRTILAGGAVVPSTPQGPFIDENFVTPPIVELDGSSQGNYQGVRGNGTGDGGDTIYQFEEDAGSQATFGVLEVVTSNDNIYSDDHADALAATRLAIFKDTVAVVQQAVLDPAFGPDLLIPGALWGLRLANTCYPVNTNQRLASVVGDVDGNSEKITLSFQPPGTGA